MPLVRTRSGRSGARDRGPLTFGKGSPTPGGQRPFAPTDLGNLAAWYRWDVDITAVAGAVSQWNDQSGNARHMTQATGLNQPIRNADGSITFDGSDDFLNATFGLNQPCTVYALLKPETWTSTDALFDGAAATFRLRQAGSTPQINFAGPTAMSTSSQLTLAAYHTFVVVGNGASSVYRVDNNADVTGDAGANNPGGITLGAQTGGGALAGNVTYREFIVYSVAHDATQRQAVTDYLRRMM